MIIDPPYWNGTGEVITQTRLRAAYKPLDTTDGYLNRRVRELDPSRPWISQVGPNPNHGFVSDERFARPGDQVIKRTNRTKTKAMYQSGVVKR